MVAKRELTVSGNLASQLRFQLYIELVFQLKISWTCPTNIRIYTPCVYAWDWMSTDVKTVDLSVGRNKNSLTTGQQVSHTAASPTSVTAVNFNTSRLVSYACGIYRRMTDNLRNSRPCDRLLYNLLLSSLPRSRS